MKTLRNKYFRHSQNYGQTRCKESGQGVVEYILVLVVGVAIVLGGVYQVNDAFRVWANNYFGDYLTCLLETGELPAIGGSGGVAGLCSDEYAPFNIADGRPLVGDPIGSGSTGSDGSDSGSGDGSGASSGGDGVNGENGGGRSRGGSSSSPSRFRASSNSSRGAATAASFKAGSQEQETGGDGILNVGQTGNQARVSRIPFRQSQSIQNGGGSKKKKTKEEKARTKVAITEKAKPNRRKLIKVGAGATAQPTVEEGEPFTFGSFLRFLIIAAILIALLLLLGGQALQMGKSLEGER